ncbi:GNAT family N-acetyltransferase [Rhodococcus sp. 14-2483-1-2]|uniref:GNAT family N-acetyltransferase n=1 Tax=Rhodococcus sp. 14-2483-1-2 TaxID=2023147 RepID=UPI000B9BB2CB|nr:GNAT family N-acetyltransferase [Rhodococcus sp. 14-2483-1-2]OZF26262.1 hypothetical protein CH295_27075 [Rhodococcus sp. 14-2483-1-2]
MNEQDVTLRVPDLLDAVELAELHVAVWLSTYGHRLPKSHFDSAAVQRREKMWSIILRNCDPSTSLVVAEHAGALVGFAHAGNPFEKLPARPLQLHSLYVADGYREFGTGQRLLDYVVADRRAQLWVADENERARKFYERNRFRADGTRAADLLPEIRMAR